MVGGGDWCKLTGANFDNAVFVCMFFIYIFYKYIFLYHVVTSSTGEFVFLVACYFVNSVLT